MKADFVFVSNKFNLCDTGTYMSPFIKGALSLDNLNTGDELVRLNHCAIMVGEDIIEAGWNKEKKRGEVILRTKTEFFSKRLPKDYEIYRGIELVNNPYDELGKPYGLKDVILYQPIRLIERKKRWRGSIDTNTHYCSKLLAYCMGEERYYEIDPEDLRNLIIKSYQ